ncbi:MAG: hypothetical protein QX197_15305 [Methylococcaceae bacterium]
MPQIELPQGSKPNASKQKVLDFTRLNPTVLKVYGKDEWSLCALGYQKKHNIQSID